MKNKIFLTGCGPAKNSISISINNSGRVTVRARLRVRVRVRGLNEPVLVSILTFF